jgi:hypothetical protein
MICGIVDTIDAFTFFKRKKWCLKRKKKRRREKKEREVEERKKMIHSLPAHVYTKFMMTARLFFSFYLFIKKINATAAAAQIIFHSIIKFT